MKEGDSPPVIFRPREAENIPIILPRSVKNKGIYALFGVVSCK